MQWASRLSKDIKYSSNIGESLEIPNSNMRMLFRNTEIDIRRNSWKS